jgi:hypothetical protein
VINRGEENRELFRMNRALGIFARKEENELQFIAFAEFCGHFTTHIL